MNPDSMTREDLATLVAEIRRVLAGCEDAGDFCLWLGDKLDVDLEAANDLEVI